MTNVLISSELKNTIRLFISVLAEEYPALSYDTNCYSPLLPHLTLLLETIAQHCFPSKIIEEVNYTQTVNEDVSDLVRCCTSSDIQKLISANFVELKTNKKKPNYLKNTLSFCLNINFAKKIRYGHVAFDDNARQLRYFRYSSLIKTGHDTSKRHKIVQKLRMNLSRPYKGLANLIYALPVSLMEGLSTSQKITYMIINKSREFEVSQGFIDFELILLSWSKSLFPNLKTVSVQHGGGYYHRLLPSLSERIEIEFSDVCYNWVGVNCSKTTAIAFPKSLKINNEQNLKLGTIHRIVVLSTYEGDGRSSLIQIKSAPQTKKEICAFENFIDNYTFLIEKKFSEHDLVFRVPPKSTGYTKNLSNNWRLCDHKKNIADYHDGKTLFVIDNLNTTLYQLLDAQIPLLFIHNREMYATNEYFDNFLRDHMPKNSYFDDLNRFEEFLSKMDLSKALSVTNNNVSFSNIK